MNKSDIKSFIENWTPEFNARFGCNGWTLGGSARLVLEGILNRDVNDIDIITVEDLYQDVRSHYLGGKSIETWGLSSKFTDREGHIIKVIGHRIGDIHVDIIFNSGFDFSNPIASIIQYKRDIVKKHSLSDKERLKHQQDLDYIDKSPSLKFQTPTENPNIKCISKGLRLFKFQDISDDMIPEMLKYPYFLAPDINSYHHLDIWQMCPSVKGGDIIKIHKEKGITRSITLNVYASDWRYCLDESRVESTEGYLIMSSESKELEKLKSLNNTFGNIFSRKSYQESYLN